MNKIPEFLIKLILFLVTYVFFLIYIIDCNVRTELGLLITCISIIIVTIGYILLKFYYLDKKDIKLFK